MPFPMYGILIDKQHFNDLNWQGNPITFLAFWVVVPCQPNTVFVHNLMLWEQFVEWWQTWCDPDVIIFHFQTTNFTMIIMFLFCKRSYLSARTQLNSPIFSMTQTTLYSDSQRCLVEFKNWFSVYGGVMQYWSCIDLQKTTWRPRLEKIPLVMSWNNLYDTQESLGFRLVRITLRENYTSWRMILFVSTILDITVFQYRRCDSPHWLFRIG